MITRDRSLRRRTAVASVALVLLSGCGSDTVTDIASPKAQACKKALADRLDGAFSAASTAAPGTSALNSLVESKPEECEALDEDLGARLVGELQAEYTAKMSALGSDLAERLSPASSASPTR